MARCFPSQLEGLDPSPEEARLFALLRDRLPEEHWVWFKPAVGGRRRGWLPDLLLLGPPYGMLVLQIADLEADRVIRGGPRWLVLRGAEGPRKLPHPEHQAREIAGAVDDRIQSALGGGRPPRVAWGVVYPRIDARGLEALEGRGVSPGAGRALTREILEDGSSRAWLEAFSRLAGTPCPPERLDVGMRKRIRAVVEPQLHFMDLREAPDPPPTAGPPPPSAPPGFWLDRKQERMARELSSPRTLVYGPAGSGKTVFLVSRAHYWRERNPGARILFTCYNASLASHLRRVFAERGLPPDGERLTVRHYHDLAGGILGMNDIHERSPEFYAALEPRLLQELSRREEIPAYDLILVDEGQDFTRRMLEVLVRLGAPGGEITLVSDPAQDIYGRWSEETLSPLGRPDVEHLIDCYRNTAPIFALALSVLPDPVQTAMGLKRLELTRPEDLGRTGPAPELVALGGLDNLRALIVEVAAGFTREKRPLSDLAVLYPDRRAIPELAARLSASRWKAGSDPRFLAGPEPEQERTEPSLGSLHPQSDRDDLPPSALPHFAQALEDELRLAGVPSEWVARDFASKAGYDITRNRLTLSTIHSAKGMDFHTVVLLGAESLTPGPGRDGRRAESLLFTGITRARERLVIPYFEDAGWVPGLWERLRGIEGGR